MTTFLLVVGAGCVLATLAVIQIADFVADELPDTIDKFITGNFTAGDVADGCRTVRWHELGESEDPREWFLNPPKALTGSLKCAPVMMKAITIAEKGRSAPLETDGYSFCVPAGEKPVVAVRRGVRAYLRFVDRHPNRRDYHYRGVMLDALLGAFPCGESA